MLSITMCSYKDLTEREKEEVPNNGSGKEYAGYIRIRHNGKTLLLESDAMEPEDARFYRDLSWIPKALKLCYNAGITDGTGEE